ncbi:MAG TPA: hypothetical protein VJ725_14320, partial [Thermoanaerobaculia bacterium]|nr:hypothetical protein [Thermoanaerobaculia bacterium]
MRASLVVFGLLLCLPLAAQPTAPADQAPAAPEQATAPAAVPPAAPAQAATPAAPAKQTYEAQISEIAPDQSMLTVLRIDRDKDPADWDEIQLTVEDTGLRSLLEKFNPDDQVKITQEGSKLGQIAILRVSIPLFDRLLALLGTAAGLILLSFVLTRHRFYRFIVGEDNRYSKSKLQAAFWFLLTMSVYLATLWLRYFKGFPPLVGGVGIPENLLLLSGISALTFSGAKGINQSRENAAAAGQRSDVKTRAAKPRPADLFTNDAGQPDLGDFQMVVITLIAGVVYTSQVISFFGVMDLCAKVAVPDVDPTLLGIFGISHGTYLTKKFVGGDTQDPPPANQ